MTFLQDMLRQAIPFAGGKDHFVIVNPNSWLANKIWQLFTDLGSGYYANKWGNEHMNGGQISSKAFYLHGTSHMCALGGKIARYH